MPPKKPITEPPDIGGFAIAGAFVFIAVLASIVAALLTCRGGPLP